MRIVRLGLLLEAVMAWDATVFEADHGLSLDRSLGDPSASSPIHPVRHLKASKKSKSSDRPGKGSMFKDLSAKDSSGKEAAGKGSSTKSQKSVAPSPHPKSFPVSPTPSPTETFVEPPTVAPEEMPTFNPVYSPIDVPTQVPASAPTATPVDIPTTVPIEAPTVTPVDVPTAVPIETPTETPVDVPTTVPIEAPTETPVDLPTTVPIDAPTVTPVDIPTTVPIDAPTQVPVAAPTETPEATPTAVPIDTPTQIPTGVVNPTDVCALAQEISAEDCINTAERLQMDIENNLSGVICDQTFIGITETIVIPENASFGYRCEVPGRCVIQGDFNTQLFRTESTGSANNGHDICFSGIQFWDGSSDPSDPVPDGGAFGLVGGTTSFVGPGCRFLNNTANSGSGGAIAVSSQGAVSVIGCLITENAASESGGAISAFNVGPSLNPEVTIINSFFFANTAPLGPDISAGDLIDSGSALVTCSANTTFCAPATTFARSGATISGCDNVELCP
jgi:predicted outer membrane repeat protein